MNQDEIIYHRTEKKFMMNNKMTFNELFYHSIVEHLTDVWWNRDEKMTIDDLLKKWKYFAVYNGYLLFSKKRFSSFKKRRGAPLVVIADKNEFYHLCCNQFVPDFAIEKLYPIRLLADFLPTRKKIIDEMLSDLETLK